jgi:isopentenyl-diphosphate delta-isomerase
MSEAFSQNVVAAGAESRKSDHIELAFNSGVKNRGVDSRFMYEPIFSGHEISVPQTNFLGKILALPLWVSSMTGGTEKAYEINKNLARASKNFGMGMGLGSCRQLLDSDERLKDFAWRKEIGDNQPFFANLGIAQVEQLWERNRFDIIKDMLQKIEADGLIVHINPLQEWLQPEGDRLHHPPIQTLIALLEKVDYPVLVKEVGQGMGYHSLKTLMELPLAAIEFAAYGGTNFSKLELLRSDEDKNAAYEVLAKIGHSANEMTDFVNDILNLEQNILCKDFIISGGINDFLDGYYHIKKINTNAIYGQASTMLRYASVSYEHLERYLYKQRDGLQLAYAYLQIK